MGFRVFFFWLNLTPPVGLDPVIASSWRLSLSRLPPLTSCVRTSCVPEVPRLRSALPCLGLSDGPFAPSLPPLVSQLFSVSPSV